MQHQRVTAFLPKHQKSSLSTHVFATSRLRCAYGTYRSYISRFTTLRPRIWVSGETLASRRRRSCLRSSNISQIRIHFHYSLSWQYSIQTRGHDVYSSWCLGRLEASGQGKETYDFPPLDYVGPDHVDCYFSTGIASCPETPNIPALSGLEWPEVGSLIYKRLSSFDNLSASLSFSQHTPCLSSIYQISQPYIPSSTNPTTQPCISQSSQPWLSPLFPLSSHLQHPTTTLRHLKHHFAPPSPQPQANNTPSFSTSSTSSTSSRIPPPPT